MTDDLERSIAAYRRALGSSVEAADAAELEDHLRERIAALRAAGRSAEVAFAEAVRRVGEPRALAREYARVTPVFGAVLPRARAWSAAALLAPTILWCLWRISRGEDTPARISMMGLMVGLEEALIFALLAGRTWARAMLLGTSLASAAGNAMMLVLPASRVFGLPFLIAHVGAAAFLMPWKRGELSDRGWALVGLGYALMVLERSLGWHSPVATVLLVSLLLGIAGVLLRARWATPVLLVAALATLPGLAQHLADLAYVSRPMFRLDLVLSALGPIAIVAAAALSWRGARSWLGTARALAR